MLIIIATFAGSIIILLGSFHVANKRNKKLQRVTIKVIGAALGFIIYILANTILNTDFDAMAKIGSYYLFGLLLLLFIQRNKFKDC